MKRKVVLLSHIQENNIKAKNNKNLIKLISSLLEIYHTKIDRQKLLLPLFNELGEIDSYSFYDKLRNDTDIYPPRYEPRQEHHLAWDPRESNYARVRDVYSFITAAIGDIVTIFSKIDKDRFLIARDERESTNTVFPNTKFTIDMRNDDLYAVVINDDKDGEIEYEIEKDTKKDEYTKLAKHLVTLYNNYLDIGVVMFSGIPPINDKETGDKFILFLKQELNK